jgi:hypothetical protein
LLPLLRGVKVDTRGQIVLEAAPEVPHHLLERTAVKHRCLLRLLQ